MDQCPIQGESKTLICFENTSEIGIKHQLHGPLGSERFSQPLSKQVAMMNIINKNCHHKTKIVLNLTADSIQQHTLTLLFVSCHNLLDNNSVSGKDS